MAFVIVYLPTAEIVYTPYFQDSICDNRIFVENYIKENDCVFSRGEPGNYCSPWYPGHPIADSPYKIAKYLLEVVEVG